MSFEFKPLTPELAVAGQLESDDMAQGAAAGFRSVIINRPGYEGGPAQPPADQVMQAAQAAGLTAVHQPVIRGHPTLPDEHTLKRYLHQLPKPILAYRRSGGRCTNLFVATHSLDDE